MLSIKDRLRMLSKIAQQTPAPSTTNAPPPTTAQTISAPPAFNADSGPWAWIRQRYNSQSADIICYLLSLIHIAMHYATNGQFNLLKDQNSIGTLDHSAVAAVDGKNLISLAKLFYRTILNNGMVFDQAPTAQQIQQWADIILQSQPLLNLSQLNPTGAAAQKLGIGSSLRQTLITNLGYLKARNPVR